jgi:hypothetical protein
MAIVDLSSHLMFYKFKLQGTLFHQKWEQPHSLSLNNDNPKLEESRELEIGNSPIIA